jgi:hypothetical protein
MARFSLFLAFSPEKKSSWFPSQAIPRHRGKIQGCRSSVTRQPLAKLENEQLKPFRDSRNCKFIASKPARKSSLINEFSTLLSSPSSVRLSLQYKVLSHLCSTLRKKNCRQTQAMAFFPPPISEYVIGTCPAHGSSIFF